jgi:flagellar motor switch protein FliG
MVQKLMREISMETLQLALVGYDKEVQDKFFLNMPKRAGAMLKDDIEYRGPVDKADADEARERICDIVLSLKAMGSDDDMEKSFALFGEEKDDVGKDDSEKTPSCGFRRADVEEELNEETNMVLIFRGNGEITDSAAVLFCDSEKKAIQCSAFMNSLKTKDGRFIYARRAEQMVEYETEKPLLVRFDQIFDCDEEVLGRALAKAGYETIITAIKGLYPLAREKILTNVPEWMEERLQAELENIKNISKEYKMSMIGTMKVKMARERIVQAVISVDRKMKKRASNGMYGEILKD